MSATARIRERLRPLSGKEFRTFGHAIGAMLHGLFVVGAIMSWEAGWYSFCVVIWIGMAWISHAALTRLHESAHHMLYRTAFSNEAAGILIGTFSLTPLSVYRHVHTQHHAHLGREKDPEFWPYNLPNSSRIRRLVYAWTELLFGWVFTPWLYSLRTAREWAGFHSQKRRRLIGEWTLLVVFWAAVVAIVNATDRWHWLLAGHLVPAWLTGSLQTVRKFTEHLGRFGNTIEGMTRTVVYEGTVGQAASATQLHVEHHGTHHRWPRIPYHHLPAATQIIDEEDQDFTTFSNHWSAVWEMLPYLLDPKLGPQWRSEPPLNLGPEDKGCRSTNGKTQVA